MITKIILKIILKKYNKFKFQHIRKFPCRLRKKIPSSQLKAELIEKYNLAEFCNFYNRSYLYGSNLYKKWLLDSRCFWIGVFFNNRLIAIGGCSKIYETNIGIPGYWFFGDRVEKKLRGRGIGHFLHRVRLEEAKKRGISRVYIDIDFDNIANLKATTDVGFRYLNNYLWNNLIREFYVRNKCPDIEKKTLFCQTGFNEIPVN